MRATAGRQTPTALLSEQLAHSYESDDAESKWVEAVLQPNNQ